MNLDKYMIIVDGKVIKELTMEQLGKKALQGTFYTSELDRSYKIEYKSDRVILITKNKRD